jgi:hypothetical protein
MGIAQDQDLMFMEKGAIFQRPQHNGQDCFPRIWRTEAFDIARIPTSSVYTGISLGQLHAWAVSMSSKKQRHSMLGIVRPFTSRENTKERKAQK